MEFNPPKSQPDKWRGCLSGPKFDGVMFIYGDTKRNVAEEMQMTIERLSIWKPRTGNGGHIGTYGNGEE